MTEQPGRVHRHFPISVMDWADVRRDVAGGLLVTGAFAAWVPDSWLQHLILTDHPVLAKSWGPLIGPAVAVVSFACPRCRHGDAGRRTRPV